jgi:hypothetical protein
MSMAEPLMPAHEPPAERSPLEHDLDSDTDVIFDVDDGTAVETPSYAPNPTFRKPTPGETLTAEQLRSDFDDQ